jgi:GAF domain-containing protein
MKLQARFLAGHLESAMEASLRAERLLWTSPSHFPTADFHFYSALAHAASCTAAHAEHRSRHWAALSGHHEQLQIWAENCPENFETRAALVSAEMARIEGREWDAQQLYEDAIRSAAANEFVNNQAVAYELAARFYLARGLDDIGALYLRKARHCYRQWGAEGKVRHLDQAYTSIREEERVNSPTSTITASNEGLDLATVIKVSQAVSGEIILDKLIDTLMRIAMEHAGAERALLMLWSGSEERIAAEATTNSDTVVVRLLDEPVTGHRVPETVLRYVLHTQESVILDDATKGDLFAADPYIRKRNARSVLCLPLANQARLIGALYLENNLAPRVFAPARATVLKLLASQAAISIENGRLYRELAEREARIRRLVDANIIGILIWKSDGRILEANDAFLAMLGYERSDLAMPGLRWTD